MSFFLQVVNCWKIEKYEDVFLNSLLCCVYIRVYISVLSFQGTLILVLTSFSLPLHFLISILSFRVRFTQISTKSTHNGIVFTCGFVGKDVPKSLENSTLYFTNCTFSVFFIFSLFLFFSVFLFFVITYLSFLSLSHSMCVYNPT